jgi:hypothetical protein
MTMSTVIDNPEQAGEIAGRRAAQQFQRAAADGTPFEKVPAARPLPGGALEAERMLESDEPEIKQSGRFWKAFLTSFNATFPGFFNQ